VSAKAAQLRSQNFVLTRPGQTDSIGLRQVDWASPPRSFT
jgi:hypothetical protein